MNVDVAKARIGSDEAAALLNGLCYEKAIERIAVIPFKAGCEESMPSSDRQKSKVVVDDSTLEILNQTFSLRELSDGELAL